MGPKLGPEFAEVARIWGLANLGPEFGGRNLGLAEVGARIWGEVGTQGREVGASQTQKRVGEVGEVGASQTQKREIRSTTPAVARGLCAVVASRLVLHGRHRTHGCTVGYARPSLRDWDGKPPTQHRLNSHNEKTTTPRHGWKTAETIYDWVSICTKGSKFGTRFAVDNGKPQCQLPSPNSLGPNLLIERLKQEAQKHDADRASSL